MGTVIKIGKTMEGLQHLIIYDAGGYIKCIIQCDIVDGRLYGHTWLDSVQAGLLCRLQESTAMDILRAVLPFQKEPEQC